MKNRMKKICIAVCAASFLGLGGAAATNVYNANADTELIFPSMYTVESEYVFGETFTVPEPARVQIGTGTLVSNAVSVVLQCPDGSTKREGDYTLDKTGKYTLTYYNANGVSATQSFVVNREYYEVNGDASAVYMESLSSKEGVDGISVTLTSGQSFSFNKPINLNDYTDSVLDVCKIYPQFRTEYDVNPNATTVSVKIVDCYEPSKFVEFYIWCGSAGNAPYYAGAGASTQMLTGLEQNSTRPDQMTEEYNGEMYKIHRVRRYQSLATYGKWLASRYDDELSKHDGVSLVWDLATHQMKAKNNGTTYFITDIDSPEIYGTNAFDFASFFTTGEVLLNVEAYNYAATAFEVEIESIFGMSGEELLNGVVVDKEAPQVFVDVETTKGNALYLQKGVEVELPKISTIRDFNYYGDASVAVYRNYGKYGQASVKVTNGAFVPNAVGNYTAVYSATDSYGNRGKYLLDLIVVEEENISFTEQKIDKLIAASVNTLPYIETNGLNKEVSVSVTAKAPNGEEAALHYNGVDGYDFVPEYAGNYTIAYTFKDNVYMRVYSYEVACVDENAATFKQPFAFPAAFMKGAAYTIDPITAYTAGDGKLNENEATVSVSVDGGAYQPLSAAQLQAYTVNASATLQFKASYQDSFVESKVYSVIDVGYGKKTTEKDYLRYMQGNYTTSELAEDGAVYGFENGTAQMQFINVVSSANFKLNFTLSATAVQDLTVILRDASATDSNYITFTYEKPNGGNVTLGVQRYENGKLVAEGSAYTKHKEWNGEYTLAFSGEGLNAEGTLIDAMRAFEKDDALVEICITGAENCAITLSQLNNQTFNTTIRESKPQMSFEQRSGAQEINSEYVVLPCYASAVMSTVLSKDVKLTVTAPNGEIAMSVDGTRLENVTADIAYSVKLTQVGQYRVSYAISCLGSTRTNGQAILENEDYYIVNVSEGIPPVIKFKDGSNSQTTVRVKLGSTHKLKDVVVSDNITAKENLQVYKMILDEYFLMEENGFNVSSYTFRNAGTFLVYVLVYDETGNCAANYYKVVVE